ncbi:MAG: biotin--[acetyl-CoA-carboxylase] ligase [Bacillota bacterium]|nr:biotin--[acetyl-CoA-carboxylase] ligase [Bacillota bacterium]
MKEDILLMLKNDTDNFVSGQNISDKLGVSRAAIWKYINQLKEDGYVIESVSKKGYKLISSPDLLTSEELSSLLNTNYIGKNIIHFDSIDSTNNKAKELANHGEGEGTVVFAEEQTLGRGRLGRSWVSPKYKGAWMSIILRPQIDPYNISLITQVGAAAVGKAMKDLDIDVCVKWPNDLILNRKKVCGILTEMSGELNQMNHVIIGIGINVNQDLEDFPSDVYNVATSVKIEKGHEISRKILVAKILNYFEEFYSDFITNLDAKNCLRFCKENSILIGKEINITRKDETFIAKAIDLNDRGELVVRYHDGRIENLISGEVSLHGFYGLI